MTWVKQRFFWCNFGSLGVERSSLSERVSAMLTLLTGKSDRSMYPLHQNSCPISETMTSSWHFPRSFNNGRSCGTNCRSSERRDIDMTSIELHGVNTLAGYNANNGDRVSVKQAKGEGVKNMCKAFQQQVKSESKLMQQSGVASQPGFVFSLPLYLECFLVQKYSDWFCLYLLFCTLWSWL